MSAARTRCPEDGPCVERAHQPDDASIFARIAGGDLAALGLLYDRYQRDVRQFLVRAVGRADADDVLHETFLLAARIAERYDGRTCARPFLIGIAAKRVRQRRRSAARLADGLRGLAEQVARWARHTPEDAASDTERMREFDLALARLSDDKRLVFLMIEREGMSGEQVSEALGVPVATVWTRLHYARKELRDALGRRDPS